MTTQTSPPQALAEPLAPSRPPIPPALLAKVPGLEQELLTYFRELPHLLEKGEENRYALIKADEVLSTWDTYRDALQAACERFGLEPFCIKQIDRGDSQRLAQLIAREEAQCR